MMVSRDGQAQLRRDHVDDPLPLVPERIERDAEGGAVLLEREHLGRGLRILDHGAGARGQRRRRRRVVHGRDRAIRPPHPQPPLAQGREGLGRGDLVHEVQVDEQDRGRVRGRGAHDVAVPDLLEQRARTGHGHAAASWARRAAPIADR
jgi:hypothetical protein